MKKLGIMQGRLVPPQAGCFQSFPSGEWEQEFPLARDAGFGAIEWIYDVRGEAENPLRTEAGLERIRAAVRQSRVQVRSVVADYYMERQLLHGDPIERRRNFEHLQWLIGQCARLRIERIVLPFVDSSRIHLPDDFDITIDCLRQLLPAVDKSGVELHLETSLAPLDFARLLANVRHPMIFVNYDSGNSASLGYDVSEEFTAYGRRIGSVHIKDRVLHGGTVPLGAGDVDFASLMRCLNNVHFDRDIILQVARGDAGDEFGWSWRNREFVESLLAGDGIAVSTAADGERVGAET